MQNSYTKEGQLSWWLAPLWRGSNPLPFKIENYFNFYPSQPAQPAQLEGPQAGPRALDIPRARLSPARPVYQPTSSVACPGLGHGPYSSGPGGPARWRPLSKTNHNSLKWTKQALRAHRNHLLVLGLKHRVRLGPHSKVLCLGFQFSKLRYK